MHKPLILGNKQFATNLIQGPLAGISCAPFRELAWQHGKPGFACTEMISCKTLLNAPLRLQQRFVTKSVREGPVCFQLSSCDPKELGQATKLATDLGADLIDLNCGCPMKKIRRKGAGSKLLQQHDLLLQLITAMKQNTHLPVSIKIRVEGGSNDEFNQQLVQVVKDSGLDYLIVHGRHWTEHYETPCNHNEIKYFVDALDIPVIGNGDIACLESFKKMLATGCAGVMIARAGVGQPWLTDKLIAELNGETYSEPSNPKIATMFIQHIQQLTDLLGSEKFALLQARQLAKYYSRNLTQRKQFCEAVNECVDLNNFLQICNQYYV